MKTVDKAMTVLGQFSLENSEIGLSELSRLACLDKAATRRLLVALGKHGFIEQSAESRKYRLGNGFLYLARIREATVPIGKAAQEIAEWLVGTTGETTHISIPMTSAMSTIAHHLPSRSNIINIIPAQPLPFHATAAGICYLAAATPDTLKHALAIKRERTTAHTIISRTELLKKIKQTRLAGYASCTNTFEEGVSSIAMAFYIDQPNPAGTISIALPDSRMTEARCTELLPSLREGVRRIEQSLSGVSIEKPG